MTEPADTPPPVPPVAPPAPPAPPEPTPPAAGNHDDLLGKIGQLLDARHDRLAGRLETALRPPAPPAPPVIDAPEPTPPAPPDDAKPARKSWYFGGAKK